jgi:hypothetical protein
MSRDRYPKPDMGESPWNPADSSNIGLIPSKKERKLLRGSLHDPVWGVKTSILILPILPSRRR